MLRVVIILIVISGSIYIHRSLQAESTCEEQLLVVTAPKSGHRTLNPSITVRGYLCDQYPLIVIRNSTTHTKTTAETEVICDDHECVYEFAARVRDLAPGTNQIQAIVPGEDPQISVEIEVIRTALAEASP